MRKAVINKIKQTYPKYMQHVSTIKIVDMRGIGNSLYAAVVTYEPPTNSNYSIDISFNTAQEFKDFCAKQEAKLAA